MLPTKRDNSIQYSGSIQFQELDTNVLSTNSFRNKELIIDSNYIDKINSINKRVDQMQNELTSIERSPQNTFDELKLSLSANVQKLNNKSIKNLVRKNGSTLKLRMLKSSKVEFRKPRGDQQSIVGQELCDHKYEKLVVSNLTINGFLNGRTTEELFTKEVNIAGNETTPSLQQINKLSAASLRVSNNKISNMPLDDLVLITPETYEINSKVVINAPVQFSEVQVEDSINDLQVIDGKLAYLRKHSNETQKITGIPIFSNVILKKPITLNGNIKSKRFQDMNPSHTVNEDIILHGDFIIRGNVTILNNLSAKNINFKKGNIVHNLQKLVDDGLRLDTKELIQPFTFHQGIEIVNLKSNAINGINPNDLLSLTSDQMQKVKGTKIINGDLNIIDGFFETDVINGIDIKQLNKSIIMKNANQFVTGTIHFNHVKASR